MEIGAEGAAGKRRHKEEGVKRRPTACPVTGGLCPAEHRSAQNKNITLCSCWTATVSPVLLALFQTFQGTGSERLSSPSPITGALQKKKEEKSSIIDRWPEPKSKNDHVCLIQAAVGAWAQGEFFFTIIEVSFLPLLPSRWISAGEPIMQRFSTEFTRNP